MQLKNTFKYLAGFSAGLVLSATMVHADCDTSGERYAITHYKSLRTSANQKFLGLCQHAKSEAKSKALEEGDSAYTNTYNNLIEQALDTMIQQLKAAGQDVKAQKTAYKEYLNARVNAHAVAQSQAKTACKTTFNNQFTTMQDRALKAIKDEYPKLWKAKSYLERDRCDVPALPTACPASIENPCDFTRFSLQQGA